MRCRACGLERSAVAVAGLSLANVGVLSWSVTVLCMTRGHTGLMDIAALRRLSKRGKAHRLRVDEHCDKAGLSCYKFQTFKKPSHDMRRCDTPLSRGVLR